MIYPYISSLRTTYSSDPFLKHFCFVHLFKSELDELPERSPAIPCSVLESLQPVNQLEAGIADESAGELLPFLRGEILSYFFFSNISEDIHCLLCPKTLFILLADTKIKDTPNLRGATFAKFCSFFFLQRN